MSECERVSTVVSVTYTHYSTDSLTLTHSLTTICTHCYTHSLTTVLTLSYSLTHSRTHTLTIDLAPPPVSPNAYVVITCYDYLPLTGHSRRVCLHGNVAGGWCHVRPLPVWFQVWLGHQCLQTTSACVRLEPKNNCNTGFNPHCNTATFKFCIPHCRETEFIYPAFCYDCSLKE